MTAETTLPPGYRRQALEYLAKHPNGAPFWNNFMRRRQSVLGAMEREGLVESEGGPSDRRWRITDKGRAAI